MSNDVWCWFLSLYKYIKEAVQNCQNKLKDNYFGGYELIANAPNPFPLVYEPDIYVSPFLSPEEASYYQTIVVVMRWMVKLGRVDIDVEVSHLSPFLAISRKGHMVSALHIMSYLIIRYNYCLVLDPPYSDINLSEFKSDGNWTDFCGDVKEANPHNASKPIGKEIELRMFVDYDHAREKTSRRSHTGYMIFMNISMIYCHTNKQATVVDAFFGAEYVAMKQGVEAMCGIRYKLLMMGVEVE